MDPPVDLVPKAKATAKAKAKAKGKAKASPPVPEQASPKRKACPKGKAKAKASPKGKAKGKAAPKAGAEAKARAKAAAAPPDEGPTRGSKRGADDEQVPEYKKKNARKSKAYRQAIAQALRDGSTREEAMAKGRDAPWFQVL